MNLDFFFNYKNRLMEHLMTDKELVDLIDDNVEHGSELIYKKVFPYQLIPDTVEESNNYLMFDVDVDKSMVGSKVQCTIYIWVLVHKTEARLPGGGVRQDAICARISELINGSMEYGMGELELYSVKRYAPAMDYNGKMMIFRAEDVNSYYNPNKHIPSNRKVF